MNGRNTVTDIFFYAFVVAGIFVATKPGGSGASFITNLGKSAVGLVQASSGQTVAVGSI
jgi:hypothetical protein